MFTHAAKKTFRINARYAFVPFARTKKCTNNIFIKYYNGTGNAARAGNLCLSHASFSHSLFSRFARIIFSSFLRSFHLTSKISELPNVTVVDCADELAEAAKTNQIYYRTDHHWTTYGASAAFKELAKQMDIPYEEDDFEAYTVHARFQGTMMSSSGFYSGTKDTIDLYLPKEPETILVTNKEAQTTTTTIYSEEGLLGNDPYEVFLGGNYGLLNIQTSSQSGRKLLLLKDSYANAMIGFLTPYFSEIDIVDPRYYSSDLDMQIAV